ncbi:MAG: hypothetical protein CMO80_23370 [Verrucomicrobiales bacterium]|nr:hypothetical protein [Verrucomicrobiales bacterium]
MQGFQGGLGVVVSLALPVIHPGKRRLALQPRSLDPHLATRQVKQDLFGLFANRRRPVFDNQRRPLAGTGYRDDLGP